MPFINTIGSALLYGFGLSNSREVGGGMVPAALYFKGSVSSSDWFDINNWYSDANGNDLASSFPGAETAVTLLTACSADMDNVDWVEPFSIDIATHDLTLSSTNSANLACFVTGTTGVVYLNGVRFNYPSSGAGRYFYPTSGSSLTTLINWYLTSDKSSPAISLPENTSSVILLGNGTVAEVTSWTAPANINIRDHTLTLTSTAGSPPNVTFILTGTGGRLITNNVTYTA